MRRFFIIVLLSLSILLCFESLLNENTTSNSNNKANYVLNDLGSQYTVHIVGNSFSAKHKLSENYRRHVQQEVEDLAVTKDGSCHTNAVWDERFAQASVYKDGTQTVIMEKMMGWGKVGGHAIAVDGQGKYAYVGIRVRNINRQDQNQYHNPVYPSTENTWYGFRRYNARTGKIAPFSKGYGVEAGVIVVNTNTGDIDGLTVHENYLYVSDTPNNLLKVYDLSNLSQEPIKTWNIDRPGKLAFDQQHKLWIVRQNTSQVVRFELTGKQLKQIDIGANVIASDIVVDPKRGLLYVTDIGQEQNVKIIGDLNSEPKLKGIFGLKEGIFAEVSGERQNLKFHNPKGIGLDQQGNLYLAQDAWSSIGGGGTIIGSYKPNGELRWQVSSSEFMSGLDLSTDNEPVLYSKERLYRWDDNRSIHSATILNPFEFPEDPRLHEHFTGVELVEINQQKLLFLSERNGKSLSVFRFQSDIYGQIAIPYAMFADGSDNQWIENDPPKNRWMWIDSNLNGKFDREEFTVDNNKLRKSWDWDISGNGDLWRVDNQAIYQIKAVTQDKLDYPQWNYNNLKKFSIPLPFTIVKRIAYDRITDSLYLSGYLENSDIPRNGWKAAGRKIARFDNWSSSPILAWIKDSPWQTDSKDGRQKPIAMAIAGDYIFIGIESTGKQKSSIEQSTVLVYTKLAGEYIGSMQQGEKIGSIMLDKAQGLNVRHTSKGDYLVFLEDAAFARSIVFQWSPLSY